MTKQPEVGGEARPAFDRPLDDAIAVVIRAGWVVTGDGITAGILNNDGKFRARPTGSKTTDLVVFDTADRLAQFLSLYLQGRPKPEQKEPTER